VSALHDEVKAKQVTIHELNVEIKDLNSTCMKMATENVAIDEKFALSKAENDELKTTIQHLESKNSKYFAEIHTLTSSLQEKVEQNEALELRVEEVSVIADNTIAANNKANEEMIAEIKVQIDKVSAENDKLTEINNTFETRNSELMSLLESMTKDGKAERSEFEKTIDDMSKKIESLASISEKLTSENKALSEQLELFKLKSNRLKASVEDLESKNNMFSSEVERLTASLTEANTSNEALQVQIKDMTTANAELSQTNKKSKKAIGKLQDALKCMTGQLNDEKTNTDKQLDDMKQLMEKFVRLSEESLADANAKNVEQRKTIDELCKSLDDAMIEIANKDIILEEKSTEIQKYLDLAAQFKSSDCAIGYGGFWR
jgi:chromosome segregation ATPase